MVDIDGVLLTGRGSCPPGFQECRTPNIPEDGTYDPAWFCPNHGLWLMEMSERFDLVWGSAWGYLANQVMAPLLGIPDMPHVPFPPPPFEPALKTEGVAAYVGDRPTAWLDDLMTPAACSWAAGRTAPTLLVPVDPAVGLTKQQVDDLLIWADGLGGGTRGTR